MVNATVYCKTKAVINTDTIFDKDAVEIISRLGFTIHQYDIHDPSFEDTITVSWDSPKDYDVGLCYIYKCIAAEKALELSKESEKYVCCYEEIKRDLISRAERGIYEMKISSLIDHLDETFINHKIAAKTRFHMLSFFTSLGLKIDYDKDMVSWK